MRRLLRLIFTLLALTSLGACSKTPEGDANPLSTWLGGQETGEFKRAIEARKFVFPDDHFAHPGYRNEWWYVTGNLTDKAGREFGYQVTFFRVGLSGKAEKRESAWASEDIWMAHIALTDINAEQHFHDQRLARGAAGLAGVQADTFKVWLEDWQMVSLQGADFPWQLSVSNADFSLDLTLQPEKPAVLQGDKGLSQKSAGVGNASYYYSLTRLKTVGTVTTPQASYKVSGLSWLDREWSTSVLAEDQVGWDWFSLQLFDGSDVMYYQLRNKSGKADAYSSGKWIDVTGRDSVLPKNEVKLEPVRFWKSVDGHEYPVEWNMSIPKSDISWRIKAVIDHQEMATVIRYWEGAVRVLDRKTNRLVGKGYLEMTGY